MRRVFGVRGRITFSGGEPAAGVWVAIVDADPEADDLLGVGVTAGDGTFRLSFTAEAFNQEEGEREERPDVYIVASLDHEAARVPVLRRDFPDLRFDEEEDLGTTALPLARGEKPVAVPGLRPSPGARKLVRRLDLDPEIVDVAAREVVKLVEHLTGFTRILDGARIEIVDTFAGVVGRRIERLSGAGASSSSVEELVKVERRIAGCDVHTYALWEPDDGVVYLNRPLLEAQNLDALRVTLGHELVHVGQSRAHPELDVELARSRAEIAACSIAGTTPSKERLDEMSRFMANIEGYAAYVEELLLRYYTHGTTIWGAKLEARALISQRRHARPLTPAEEKAAKGRSWKDLLESGAHGKSSQYDAGRAAYVARASGETEAARFDPTLRPEPRYESSTLALVEGFAKAGHVPSQFELGVILTEGRGGVERDLVAAEGWFRRAAEGGLAVAAHALGAYLPIGHPERIKWLRAGAEQGFAPAQHSLGLALLEAGPEHDAKAGIAWLEKAAAQQRVSAMRTLAMVYENAIGVGRDLVSARLWTKRADAAERG